MPKKFENFNNPRKKALAGMKQSISAELWEKKGGEANGKTKVGPCWRSFIQSKL